MYNITKKENTVFQKIEKILNFIFRDKEYSFWFITLFHNSFFIYLFLSIVFFKKKTFKFKLSIFLFIFISFISVYLNGDPIIQLERFILKNNSWFGIYEILDFFKIPITKKNINLSFFSLIIFMYYTIIFKIFIKK